MRPIFVTMLAVAGLVVVSCGGGDDDDSMPLREVAAYIRTQQVEHTFQPQGLAIVDGEHDCLIPTRPTPGAVLEGTCEWSTEKAGEGWIVRFRETWKCADFNELQGSNTFCPGETGSREWAYEVSKEGFVKLQVENGDTPPESLSGSNGVPAQTVAPTP
jgi:hypothetical protein